MTRNNFQWNFNKHTTISFQWKTFEDVVCKMGPFLTISVSAMSDLFSHLAYPQAHSITASVKYYCKWHRPTPYATARMHRDIEWLWSDLCALFARVRLCYIRPRFDMTQLACLVRVPYKISNAASNEPTFNAFKHHIWGPILTWLTFNPSMDK